MASRSPVGGLGSNQYQTKPGGSTTPPRSRELLAAVENTDVEPDQVAWTFAPDEPGAWEWAFPDHSDAQKVLGGVYGDALAAKEEIGAVPKEIDLDTWMTLRAGGVAMAMGGGRLTDIAASWRGFNRDQYPKVKYLGAEVNEQGDIEIEIEIEGDSWTLATQPDVGGDDREVMRGEDPDSPYGRESSLHNFLDGQYPDSGYGDQVSSDFGDQLQGFLQEWDSIRYQHGALGVQMAHERVLAKGLCPDPT